MPVCAAAGSIRTREIIRVESSFMPEKLKKGSPIKIQRYTHLNTNASFCI
jgi:hypothetical protein